MSTKLTFWNGTDDATGSEFLLDTGSFKVLVDCGLTQGPAHFEARNKESFGHNPSEINTLLVTHAHMDHIGRIPKLVRDGFRGPIISTPPTKELAFLMFRDALKIMAMKSREFNEEPLYAEEDADHALRLWETREYHEHFSVGPFSVHFKDAGHILGSSMIEIRGGKGSILFSGDLGNTPHDFLRDTESPDGADYIVMESVYGDRNHEDKENRSKHFKEVVERAIKKNGTLLIPVFSLERSQDILFELNSLVESGAIKNVPIFLDSPLAIDVTKVYQESSKYFKEEAQAQIKGGDDLFAFKGLELTYTSEDSKEIEREGNPKIIIAGSGMSHGGRILSHEIEYLGDPKTTILFVGYQIPGSVGRRILDGATKVRIEDTWIKVRSDVHSIFSYSAHKDSDHLIEFAASDKSLKELFIVLGEPKSRMFLAQRLRDYHNIRATLPERGQSVEIEI
jgi:metallo-beta-lactamase family protein